MHLTLIAKSSSGDHGYNVLFLVQEGKLSVDCDCPAGIWGKFCKHKWQLLNGDQDMLLDASQAEDLQKVAALAQERNIDELYSNTEKLNKEKKIKLKQQKKEKLTVKKTISNSDHLTKSEFAEINSNFYSITHDLDYISYMISQERKRIETKLREGF